MEGPPVFAEMPDDDDDSEVTAEKKRRKKAEAQQSTEEETPKRVRLENLFVREDVQSNKKEADAFHKKKETDKQEEKTEYEGVLEIPHGKAQEESESEVEETPEQTADQEQGESTPPTQETEHGGEPADVEQLDDEESRYVVESIAEDRSGQIQQELSQAEPDSAEAAEAVADAAFMEALLDRTSRGEHIDESVMDSALAEASQDVGIAPEAPVEGEEQEPEAEPEEETQPEQAEQSADAESAEEEDDQTPANAGPAYGGGQGASPPPPPGTLATPPPPAGPPVGPSATGMHTVVHGAPETHLATDNNRQEGHSHAKHVLAGGIVGYLVGRRRGRIKSEKKLLPVQHKLETQVDDLSQQVSEREQRIRAMARKQHQEKPIDTHAAIENLNQRSEKRQDVRREEQAVTPESTVQSAREMPQQTEKVPVEKASEQQTEADISREIKGEKTETPPTVEKMQLRDLLEVASNLQLDGETVKQIFESGRLDMDSLRRVVREHLRNGDFKGELLKSIKPETAQTDSPESIQSHQQSEKNQETDPSKTPDLSHIQETLNQQYQEYAPQQPQLETRQEAPQPEQPGLVDIPSEEEASKQDTVRKVVYGVAGTVAVVILAVIVGLILLQFV